MAPWSWWRRLRRSQASKVESQTVCQELKPPLAPEGPIADLEGVWLAQSDNVLRVRPRPFPE
jgi:hypothetical protein